MSRSRRTRKHTPKQRLPEASAADNCDDLEEKAQAALASGRRKDASVIYKALLKGERRDVWLAGLGSAYAGRASDLADKGMKEALVIWEQRAAGSEL